VSRVLNLRPAVRIVMQSGQVPFWFCSLKVEWPCIHSYLTVT